MASKDPSAQDIAIGSRVRAFRLARNVSQEKLGEALGVTFQQLQKYEKGRNRIPAGRLQQIAELLDVPVASFYEEIPHALALKGSWRLPHGNRASTRGVDHTLPARLDVAKRIATVAGALGREAHAAGFGTLGRLLDLAAIEARGHAGIVS